MKTVVSSKGQIVLPAEVRRMDDIRAGHTFEIERLERGDYRLRRVEVAPNEGLVDWLLACPAKGFLGEPDRLETTDSILPGIR